MVIKYDSAFRYVCSSVSHQTIDLPGTLKTLIFVHVQNTEPENGVEDVDER